MSRIFPLCTLPTQLHPTTTPLSLQGGGSASFSTGPSSGDGKAGTASFAAQPTGEDAGLLAGLQKKLQSLGLAGVIAYGEHCRLFDVHAELGPALGCCSLASECAPPSPPPPCRRRPDDAAQTRMPSSWE